MWKQFFREAETYVVNEFFILASGNGFLFSGNSVLLFSALLKFLKFVASNFF